MARSACTSPTTATRRATTQPAQLAQELMEMGIECFRVLFPKGMDANEYALQGDSQRRRVWACC